MRRLAPIAIALQLVVAQLAHAQPKLPPRSSADLVALIKSVASDTRQTAEARNLLDTPIPEGLSNDQRAKLLTERARAASLLGLNDRYLTEIRAAWEAAGKSFDPKYVQTRIEFLAAEIHSGNLVSAIEMAEAHTKVATSAGSRLATHAFLVENFSRHGDIAAAEKHLKLAEIDFNLVNTNPRGGWGLWGDSWQANIERARAGIALGRGKYDEAERHFRNNAEFRAKDLEANLRRQAQGVDTVSQAIANGFYLIAKRGQADMLIQQGRLIEAEMLYREIIESAVREFGPGHPFVHIYIEGMTNVLIQQGRLSDARNLAEASLQLQLQQGITPESRTVTSTRSRLASTHVALRDWEAAHIQYQAINSALERDSNLKARLGRGDKDWALTLLRVGQPVAAEQMMLNLLADDSRRFVEGGNEIAETRGMYAMMLAANGKTSEALAEFRTALPVLLQAQKDAGEEELAATTRRLVVILEAYIDLLYSLHSRGQQVTGLDIPAEAFRVADVARGSSVQKALLASAARSANQNPKLAQLAREEQDLSHQINTLNDTLSRLHSAPPAQRLEKIIADIRRDLPELKARRIKLREQIDREFPEYANLINPQPLRPVDVQRLLQPGEALLATYVGEQRSYVWSVDATGNTQFATSALGSKAVATRVAAIRRSLDLGNNTLLESELDLDSAHALYAQFVQPVSTGLGHAEHLLVVPHGALGQIPFALFPTKPSKLGRSTLTFAAYAEIPWLIRERAITQLPSVSTLYALRHFAPQRRGERSAFIGFGDPLFNEKQATEASREAAPVKLAGRNFGLRFSPGTRSASSATIADLARLPDTATELFEIANTLKTDATQTVRIGKSATESSVKESRLDDYRIVVFATHGLIPGDLNGLTQPALALTNPAVTGEKEADGLLTMEEILALKMNADWVVLSACNTASSDGLSAEAVSGLGRAFFYAGTRALLVTNWPVETVSARLLTTEVFRRQAEQPALSRAQALRSAMLTVMKGQALNPSNGKPEFSYAHPLFWAPYSLVGDGGNQ